MRRWWAEWWWFGSERRYLEPSWLKRILLRCWGWRQAGPRIRYWHLARALPRASPRRVLEVGCGWGQNLFALAQRWPEAEYVGIDRDPQALDAVTRMARARATHQLRVVRATLPALAVDGPFDMALIVDVLEYIEEDVAVLRQLRTVMHAQGILLIHVPRRMTEQRQYLPVSHATPGHVREEYTREEIVDKVRTAGWTVTALHPTFGCWGTLAWECARLSERARPLGALVFPLVLLLAKLDCWGARREGNGYLVVATPGGTS